MQTHQITTAVVVGLVLIWAISRQFLPRRVTRVPFIILPVIGILEAIQSLPKPTIPPNQLLEAAIAISISIVIGFLQAQITHVYTDASGQVFMEGGWIYLFLWVLLFISRIVTDMAFRHTGHPFVAWIVWAELTSVWGVRGVVLYLKHPQIREQLARRKRGRMHLH